MISFFVLLALCSGSLQAQAASFDTAKANKEVSEGDTGKLILKGPIPKGPVAGEGADPEWSKVDYLQNHLGTPEGDQIVIVHLPMSKPYLAKLVGRDKRNVQVKGDHGPIPALLSELDSVSPKSFRNIPKFFTTIESIENFPLDPAMSLVLCDEFPETANLFDYGVVTNKIVVKNFSWHDYYVVHYREQGHPEISSGSNYLIDATTCREVN